MDRKATVLVVDDEPHVRRLVKANLESSGYKVLTAADGNQAINVVESETPDLVILDLMLPKLDGYAVCDAQPASGRPGSSPTGRRGIPRTPDNRTPRGIGAPRAAGQRSRGR